MNELYHHGILGMKWGVRRFQNDDGSLTPAGQQRYRKMNDYRDRLANKATRKSEKYSNSAKEARRNVADLKKNGANSQVYKDWKEDRDSWREWDYENKHSVTQNEQRYVKKYQGSADQFFNNLGDYIERDRKVAELIYSNEQAAKRYTQKAKTWQQRNQNLMNMNVDALTPKRDIRYQYRGW